MSEWISVDERLPEIQIPVLVAEKYSSEILIAERFENGYWYEQHEYGSFCVDREMYLVDQDSAMSVTHWMPLPYHPDPLMRPPLLR